MSPQFTFLYPALNFRNTEIGAAIGLNQLKNLTKNNSNRSNNFKYFINLLDDNKYWKAFDLKGNSNSNENNIERPINVENIPFRIYFKDLNTPNKNINKLYEKKKRKAGIL